jgi:acetyltransferase-like isoleucine patch superfamily enzyme
MIKQVLKDTLNVYYTYKSRQLKARLNRCGNGVVLERNVEIVFPHKMVIEDYVYIGPGAIIQALGGVTIKSGAIIGPRLKIHSANHQFKNATSIPYDETFDKRPVVINENVWIGGDVIIVPGVNIGEGSIIGAGSVVSGIIPPFSIAVGNPAKVIKKRDEDHYTRLKNEGKIYLKLKLEGTIKPDHG